MEIRNNIPLAPLTTFVIGGPATHYCEPRSVEDLQTAFGYAAERRLPVFILGGGSNILVSDEGFHGLVIHPSMEGREIIEETDTHVAIKLAAGEDWDHAVAWAVERGWWGMENLSHIPGTCGAFAVQNVGAYGQEASQVVKNVEVFDIADGQIKTVSNKECSFEYRKSIFNTTRRGAYVILSVTLELSKLPAPNISYGDVQKYFTDRGIQNPNQQQIREAITAIRDTKFPYPSGPVNGSAGSFFRGPLITEEHLVRIETVVSEKYGQEAATRLAAMKDRLRVPQGYKTPTAFLLDIANLKGFQVGGAQVNPRQPAIVLNATGTATARDVLELRDYVLRTIKEAFDVDLEIEPEFVGF